MSMADDYDGYEPDDFETDDSIFREYLLGCLFWNTKDRKKINIIEMTDSHIENCIRIPLYNNKENWDIVFKFELNRRLQLKIK